MKNKWARRLCSVTLSAVMLYTISFPVHGEEKTTAISIQENKDIPAIEVSSSTLLDADKKPVPIGSSQEITEQELLDRIEKGEATAVKSGVFVSDNDALNGIVQITFQIAGKENQSDKPINVMLILDQTGSMNMYCTHDSTFMMDCLNQDHYYYIPAGTFGNHGGGFVRIADFNPEGPVFKSWYGEDDQGRKYVPEWVVEMLDSLPAESAEQDNENSDQDLKAPSPDESGIQDQTETAETPDEHSELSPAAASESAVTAAAAGNTSIELNETDLPDPEDQQNKVSESDSTGAGTATSGTQKPAAEQAQQSVSETSQESQTIETELVEEWVEIPQEPEYETVTETVMVYPEPYTVEETEMQMVEPEPVLNEETGEMEQGEPSMQEVTVTRTITPEPYETTVEKQVPVQKDPVLQKVTHSVEKTVEQPAAQQSTEAFSSLDMSDEMEPERSADISAVPADESAAQSAESPNDEDRGAAASVPSEPEKEQMPQNADSQTDISETDQKNPDDGLPDEQENNEEEQAENVQETDLYTPVYDSGYNVDYYSMIRWNPNSNHYHLVNGEFEKIEQPAYTAQSLNGQILNYEFYSPAEDNEAGCVDRAILQKEYVKNFVKNVLAENPENKIAIELFNNDDSQVLRTDFTSDYGSLLSALNFTQGGSNTNYELAFNTASEMIENSNGFMKDCALYTLFVSDGQPNRALMLPEADLQDEYEKYGGFYEYAGYIGARNYREKYPQTLYAVGLQTNISSYLSELASDPRYALDCSSMDQFNTFLQYVQTTWLKEHPQNGVLEDVVADGFTLLISNTHPFRIDDTVYTTAKTLPENVTVNGKTIRISLGTLTEKQRKISFFVKADPELLRNDKEWTDLPTNESAVLTYNPVLIDENRDLILGQNASVSMPSPYTRFGYSQITAVKSNSREGETLRPGDEITYTITVRNEGLNDLDHLMIADPLPDGTEYVSGGKFSNGNICFDVNDLKAGTSRQVSFTVRIMKDAHDQGIDLIENTGYFGLQPDDNGKPDLPTNRVENPLMPEPEGQPEPETPEKPAMPDFSETSGSSVQRKAPVTAAVIGSKPMSILGLVSAAAGLYILTAEKKLSKKKKD